MKIRDLWQVCDSDSDDRDTDEDIEKSCALVIRSDIDQLYIIYYSFMDKKNLFLLAGLLRYYFLSLNTIYFTTILLSSIFKSNIVEHAMSSHPGDTGKVAF